MENVLSDFVQKYEAYLKADEELERRLQGFKTFSGMPNGHYTRAREEGAQATARAVRCYPFGGESKLKDCEVVGLHLKDDAVDTRFAVCLEDGEFTVKSGSWNNPHLTLQLSKELFKKAVLGRHRWLWVIGMDDVAVTYAENLPHSDWVTIFEILVAMQELVEFNSDLLEKVESY